MRKNDSHPAEFEQPDFASFLSLYLDVIPEPFLNDTGRVAFRFSAVDVAPAVSAFYQNHPVPIADFCQRLKLIRSMIFNMKGGRR
jgi:hypothetical protein